MPTRIKQHFTTARPQQRPSQQRRKYSSELDRQLVETSSRRVLETVGHDLLLDLNDGKWPMESVEALQNYPKCLVSAPQPVHVAPTLCLDWDVCQRRTAIHQNLHHIRTLCRRRYDQMKRNYKVFRSAKDGTVAPKNFFKLAECIHNDPDLYFDCSYDYHYTGGNLCILGGDLQYVVHIDGDNLQNLNVSTLTAEADQLNNFKLTAKCSAKAMVNNDVFEVAPFINQNNEKHTVCFAARQHKSITLYSVQPQGLYALTQFKTARTPFISFTQPLGQPERFVVSSLNQEVRIYDVNSRIPVLSGRYDLNDETKNDVVWSWNTVKAWQEHTILFANLTHLGLMDIRTAPRSWLKSAFNFYDADMPCDHISALGVSRFKHLIYIASSHKLHCFDQRYMRKQHLATSISSSNGAVCTWTHGLSYAPLMLQTYEKHGSEFIALASALAGDIRICELTRERNVLRSFPTETELDQKSPKYHYKSVSLPYQPPTLQEAYESARLVGKCLQPEANMKKRVARCCTGLIFHDRGDSESACLLSATSSGDVFAHTLTERESQQLEARTNAFTDAVMGQFADAVCALEQPPLQCSKVVRMEGLRKVLRCSALSVPLEQALHESAESGEDEAVPRAQQLLMDTTKRKRRRHQSLGGWQKSLDELNSYKDLLVQNILGIWDVDDVDQRLAHIDRQLEDESNMDTKSLVNWWMDSNVEVRTEIVPTLDSTEMFDSFMENAITSTQIPLNLEDSVVSNRVTTFLSTQPNTTLNSERSVKSKASKKKKNYIKGF